MYVDSAFVRSLLPPALSWLYPYLPWMQALEIGDVSAFCSTDPPSVPSIPSAGDIFQFVTGGNVGAVIVVNQFLQDVAKQYLWRSLCQCGTGTPTAYTPPSDPGGLVSVNNPTIVSPLTPQACYDFTSSTVVYNAGNSLQRTIVNLGGNNPSLGPITPAYYVRWTTTTAVVTAPAPTLTVTYVVDNESSTPNVVYSSTAFQIAAGLTRVFVAPIPIQASTVNYRVAAGSTGFQASEFTRTEVFCTNTAPGTTDCCAQGPDQSNILLRQILDLVTLIQRQRVPYAYVDGATHSGLSGAGTLTVPSGLIGLRTTVTTNPPYTGQAGSNPQAIFDVGYVSTGDSTGWAETQPIRRSPWIWFPEDMSTWSRVGFNLNPGVVISITELEAEV